MGSGAIDSIPHFKFKIMARKKIVEETIVESQVPSETDVTQAPETTSASEIPDTVDKLLKSYPSYSALYIDSRGGVYPKDTQPNLVKDAILYQNPYYKS